MRLMSSSESPYPPGRPPFGRGALLFELEAHDAGATLYLSGTLSSASALHVMRLCDRLPTAIRTLRVDLRTATVLDSSALDALGVGLRRWRHARGGMTRVVARHRTAVGAAR